MAVAILDLEAFKMLQGIKIKCFKFASPNISLVLSKRRNDPGQDRENHIFIVCQFLIL